MKKEIILLSVIIVLLSSCKSDGPHYKLYEQAKEWGNFKTGTWWKYKNDETDEKDCVWIDNTISDILYNEIDGKIIESGDYINLYTNSTDTSKEILMRLSAGDEGSHFSIREDSKYNSCYTFYLANLLTFDSLLIDSTNESYIAEKYSSFSLNGIDYINVIHVVSNKYDQTNPVLNYEYYSVNEYWIAKYGGIIKKILRNPCDTTSWSLTDCYIIK